MSEHAKQALAEIGGEPLVGSGGGSVTEKLWRCQRHY
jgi:hypothetical protein